MTQSRSIPEEVKELLKCSSRAGITTVIDFLSGRETKKKLLWRLIQTRARTVLLLSVKDQFSDDFVAPSGGKWGKVGHFSHICTPLGTPHTHAGDPPLSGRIFPELASCTPDIPGQKILLACCHTAGNTVPGPSHLAVSTLLNDVIQIN